MTSSRLPPWSSIKDDGCSSSKKINIALPISSQSTSLNSSDVNKDASQTIKLDGFELIRYIFKESQRLSSNNNLLNTQTHTVSSQENYLDNTHNYLGTNENVDWLIGTSMDPKLVPLLHIIRVTPGDILKQTPLIIFIQSMNLKIEGLQLCSWKDRHGNHFTFGDIILFVLQLQTNVTTSRHITALGHLPISLLNRKNLLSALESPVIDQTQYPFYDPSINTIGSLIDPNSPLCIQSLDSFQQIFRCSLLDGFILNVMLDKHRLYPAMINSSLSQDITQSNMIYSEDTNGAHTIDQEIQSKRYTELAAMQSLLHCKKEYDDLNISERLLQRSFIPKALHTLHPYDYSSTNDLLISNNLEESALILSTQTNVLGHNAVFCVGRLIGPDIESLFDQHMSLTHLKISRTQQDEQKTVTKRLKSENVLEDIKPHVPVTQSLSRKRPSSVIYKTIKSDTPKHHSKSLLEYLISKRAKPIIIIPPAAGTQSSPTVLNIGNCQYFFEEKQLPIGIPTTPIHGSFSWKAVIPTIDSACRNGQTTVELKVVESSQTSKFRPEDWYRTIAVILQGPEWQLSSWPFSSLESLFRCIKPIYFAFETDPLPSLVQRYGVEVLRLKRTARHADATALRQFLHGLGTILNAPRNFKLFDSRILNKLYAK